FHDPAGRILVASIRLGGEPIGSIALRGPALSDTALQALANLVAIGLEKARSQEAANRAEASRQSQELKSTLLDAIAHEFKTPLTSIKAAATALLARPLPPSPQQKELLTVVDEEADRLARLVTEAIQTARIEGGKLQLNRALHSAATLVAAALRESKPLSEGRTVAVEVAPELPLVFVDPEMIQLALRQLIDNALKYSAPAGPVTVGARSARDGVSIDVADRGPGIAPDEQSRIFDKFYRSSGAQRQVTGSGMGLAIAREVVRAHGGDVTVESAPAGGSTFSVWLPAAAQDPQERPQPQEKTA
ncbi:MAG TPA: ATP-binding protein, partial [Terriglobia bacterium]|nr:ATP-binding protein [Terriglobia bacterium]